MKINGVYLIKDKPLDIVFIEWCKPNYKKMSQTINYYKSLGYIVLIEKVSKHNIRDIVYGVNCEYHICFTK